MDITIPINVGLSGRAIFEVIDLQTGLVEHVHEQHNMILDSGLEAFGSTSSVSGTSGSMTYLNWGQWRTYFAVGTGSTAPAVGQTTLTNQVVIQGDTGGFQSEQSEVYSYDAINGYYKATITQVRVINFVASYNLTEWGLAKAATGSLSIRELFRDGSNNPTTIAVASGKQLKLTHILTLTLPNTLGAVSFDLTGLGTQSGNGGFWATSTGIATLFQELLTTSGSFKVAFHATDIALPTANQVGTWFFSSVGYNHGTTDTYVGNSRKITKRIALTTAQANMTMREMVLGSNIITSANIASGFIFKWTTPLIKTASNTVTFVIDVNFTRGP
ncbi:hypothetical protein [Deinococcus roseus]|uniref:Tail protein n=1 Tax=Deinococcus roseus TaxID=392414 RepID=A0ABQ2DGE3_9DEIO|nr:hypothetical protein [Deinococcus roseus]GGJ56674.1 hypothetical protein GCM10008938_48520 [Deinococcus roseus]